MSSEIEARLASLQRRQRWLLLVAVAPWALLASLAIQGARGALVLPCEVRARGFVLEAEGSEALATLRADESGGAGELRLQSDHGGLLASLGDQFGQGGVLQVYSAQGERAGRFGMAPDGLPAAALGHSACSEFAVLGATPDGAGAIELRNSGGAPAFRVANTADMAPRVELWSPAGIEAVFLESVDSGGVLRLYTGEGTNHVYAGANSQGAGFVATYATEGGITAAMGQTTKRKGGFIKAFSSEGSPLFYGGANGNGDGQVTVSNATGQQIFAAGPDGRNQGGVINVHDTAGQMVLRVPDWP